MGSLAALSAALRQNCGAVAGVKACRLLPSDGQPEVTSADSIRAIISGWPILGADGDDGDHAIVVVLPGLYRCADCLEWGQSIARVGNAAFWLTKNTSPVELQTG